MLSATPKCVSPPSMVLYIQGWGDPDLADITPPEPLNSEQQRPAHLVLILIRYQG
jgi:hypothetical protein